MSLNLVFLSLNFLPVKFETSVVNWHMDRPSGHFGRQKPPEVWVADWGKGVENREVGNQRFGDFQEILQLKFRD